MNSGITELAKMFKERDRVSPPSITTGTVVEVPPNPRIRLNDVIVLESSNLIFSGSMELEYYDEVILMPTMDGQLYYVLGKAVRYG